MSSPRVPPKKLKAAEIDIRSRMYKRDEVSARNRLSHDVVTKLANRIGIPFGNRNAEQPVQSEEKTEDSWRISIPKGRIRSLEELVEHCKIDLKVWSVERFVCNKWEVGAKTGPDAVLMVDPLFQVKAFLKRRRDLAGVHAEIDALREAAKQYSPKFTGWKTRQTSGSGVLAELSIVDHHFGGMVWGKETNGEDWDLKISEEAWKDATLALIERTRGYRPERALVILGNDQQNADNRAGMTENLTPQAMDGRYEKVSDISLNCSIFQIDEAEKAYGKVSVIGVPGNHDPVTTFHLTRALSLFYRNNPNITVDYSLLARKYVEYGVNMIMFTHGNKGKLEDYDRIMATEKPEMWGRTRWREAHTADKHHRKEIEQKGATIRILPSLRPSCAWSYESGHIGSIRAAQAFLWSKNEGLIGQASYSILQPREHV